MGTATTLVEFHSNIILIMRISAIMPIKLHNERCPGKNTRMLGNKPLLQHELDNLKATGLCDKICVFCSDESVTQYLPQGVDFIKRSLELDLPTSNFTQIFAAFMEVEKADIYVYAHATAPFITKETMTQCIEAVKSGEYDSAFCAVTKEVFLNCHRRIGHKPFIKEVSFKEAIDIDMPEDFELAEIFDKINL